MLNQLLQAYPDQDQALLLKGIALFYKQDFPEARKHFERSVDINPNNPDTWNNLGNTCVKEHDNARACIAFEKVLELDRSRQDAAFNLAVCLNKLGRVEEAELVLTRLLNQRADHPGAWSTLGAVQQAQGKQEEALASYDRCLALDQSSALALHNKAVILRQLKRYDEAVSYSKRAVKLNPGAANVHQNLGSAHAAMGEIDQAIKAYERAVKLEPRNPEHHHWLNHLLWIEGKQGFLDSYFDVIRAQPEAQEIRQALVYKLMLSERLEEAQEHADYLVRLDPENPSNLLLQGGVLLRQRQFEAALTAHDQALQKSGGDIGCKREFATTLLANAEPARAMSILDELLVTDPLNQSYWALKATALRLLGSDQYHELYDYERLVLRTPISVPQGYDSIGAFNRELKSALEALHINKEHPLDQSLVNGTQTIDDLFEGAQGPIGQLERAFDEQMIQFLGQLPPDVRHPTLARNGAGFICTGAWSVLLRTSGYHRNHHHSAGWFSGPYYVDVPEAAEDAELRQGWIQFGAPSFECIEPLAADYVVKPEPGLMIRFPSYMWHGTIPFDSDETRMVVSVDLDPGPGAGIPELESQPAVGGPSSAGIASF